LSTEGQYAIRSNTGNGKNSRALPGARNSRFHEDASTQSKGQGVRVCLEELQLGMDFNGCCAEGGCDISYVCLFVFSIFV
jgi:hypothetical protein